MFKLSMMRHPPRERRISFSNFPSAGFSLVELIVVIALSAALFTIVVGAFSTVNRREALGKEADIARSLLEQARAFTLDSRNASVYGVHFESAKAVLFASTTYDSSAPSNIIEVFNPLVKLASITLATGGSDIVFNRLTGETAASGTVAFSLVSDATQVKTISVSTTGVAEVH